MAYDNFNVLWLTGMSGSGKSTLASSVEIFCKKRKFNVYTIDGDEVRDKDARKLGFGRKDVFKNNIRIAELCLDLKNKGFNIVIVPVISPYEEIRNKVKSMLEPNLHLVYVRADIDSLRERDTKGLYAAADSGIINDLIGYSDINPYDEPNNAEIVIDTSIGTSLKTSKSKILNYIEDYICV
jgi:adenylylsulfate kinase